MTKKTLTIAVMAALLCGAPVLVSVFAPVLAHGPGTYESPIVEKRVMRFKQSGSDIQAVFKRHLPAQDYQAIEAAAARMADWADEIPNHFPVGSTSVGAKDDIWPNFADFKAKAEANAIAARNLQAVAASRNAGQITKAAQQVGASCKSCHDSYRIKH